MKRAILAICLIVMATTIPACSSPTASPPPPPPEPVVEADITARGVYCKVDHNNSSTGYVYRVRAKINLVEIAGVDYRIDLIRIDGRGPHEEYDSTEISPVDITRQCGSRDVEGGTSWTETIKFPWDWNLNPWAELGINEWGANFDAWQLTVNVTDANGHVIRLNDQGPDW